MRHQQKKTQLNTSDKGHRTLLLRNLAMALIIYEKIKTTEAKARAVKPFVEHLINIAKSKKEKREGIRMINNLLQHENSSKKIFEVLIPKYANRTGGYIRITRLGYRSGDASPVVQVELI